MRAANYATGSITLVFGIAVLGVAALSGAIFGSSAAAAFPTTSDRASAPGAPDAATVASPNKPAAADAIVVTNGKVTIKIKRVKVAGSPLPAAEIAALFDTKDPKALEARLRKLDAAAVMIPEMTADSVDGTTEAHFTQQQILLADVHGGRAATGSAAKATLTIKDGKTDTRFSTGATTFKGLDLAQIVHLATGPRVNDDEALRPLCDELAVQSTTIGSADRDGQPLTIATIRETGLKGRPLKVKIADAADRDRGTALLDDAAHSFSAEGIEVEGIEAEGSAFAAGTSTKGLKSFAVRHVAARGFGDGRLASFELSGLALQGNEKQPGRITLGSAEIGNLASNATPVPSIDRIDLRDLVLDIPVESKPGEGKAEDGKPVQQIALSVKHAGYAAPGLVIGKLPPRATLSIEHAAFDPPPDSGATPMLLAMGYKHLDLSSETISRYDGAARTLQLDRLSVSGVGMGMLDVKLGMANVSNGIVSQDDAVQKAAAAAVLLTSLKLTLRNDGLVDKAIAFKAAIDGLSVEEERTNIVQLVDTGLVGFGLQSSAKAQAIVAALHKFVADPKSLHIALASKTGLGADAMERLDSPQALLDAVEVEAGAD